MLFKNYDGFIDMTGLCGSCSTDLMELMQQMLIRNPEERKSASELLSSPLFLDREFGEGSRLLSGRYKKYPMMYP